METARPTSLEALAAAVADALASGTPLELVGRASKRGLGRPVVASRFLDLSGLKGLAFYEPEELVLKAGAGTSLAEIEAVIAQRGQMLAFEPCDLGPLYGGPDGAGTLGGAIACNLGGPRRLKAGAARDHFLGFAGVSGRGEIFKAGGRVMKNVTGYDLPKLMAGSYGTLAALAEITVRVHPAPEATRTVLVMGLDDVRAVEAMALAVGSPHEVSGAAHLPGGEAMMSAVDRVAAAGSSTTCLRLEGPPASVAYRAAALEAMLRPFGAPVASLEREESLALWLEIRDARFFAANRLDQRMPIWRLSVPPASGAHVAEAVRDTVAGARYVFDWAGGLIWFALPPEVEAHAGAVRGAVAAHGGHATLIRAEEAVRRAVPVFEPEPPALAALTARVKAAFDPLHILNRGRMRADG